MTTLIRASVVAGIVVLAGGLMAAEAGKTPLRYAVEANRGFALDLYRQLAKENADKNLFFSPYSMSVALAMTAEGARGQTALEMGRALNFPAAAKRSGPDAAWVPWDDTLIDAGLDDLNRRYNTQKDGALAVANALWGDKAYPFAKSYVETIDKFYGTGRVRSVDFFHDPDAAQRLINAWAEAQTRQKIKDLIPPGVLDRDTVLVLTNAIYFKGAWGEPFPADATKEADFYIGGGRKSRVKMMHHDALEAARYAAFNGDGTFFETPMDTGGARQGADAIRVAQNYPDEHGFVMLELPYQDEKFSLLVLLPEAVDGLASLEKMLTPASLQEWIGKLKQRPVNVFLPKVKLDADYDMKEPLMGLGMVRAFRTTAQFDGMSDKRNPRLFIGAVLHKAFLDIDERGTEAAAATAVVMPTAPATERPPSFVPTFRADRPFVLLIYDREDDNVLFLGRMLKP